VRLHARIYLHSLAVLVIACVATAATFTFGARGAMMQEIGERVARHLASDVAGVIDEPDVLARRLERINDELGVAVTVRNPGGRVVAATGRPLPHRGWSASNA
jgi:archaellum component FlaG (FlaF/FlaG flagellin family)